ncbi:MAG: hypothetical protein ACOVOR_03560 [Rhabdochlamydiaceae bacterium]
MSSSILNLTPSPSDLLLKPILGEGRELRKKAVVEHLAKHHFSSSIMDSIENRDYKCRALCKGKEDQVVGILAYKDRLMTRYEDVGYKHVFSIKLLELTAKSDDKKHLDILLNEAKQEAIAKKAHFIFIDTVNMSHQQVNDLSSKGFKVADKRVSQIENGIFYILKLQDDPKIAEASKKRNRDSGSFQELVEDAKNYQQELELRKKENEPEKAHVIKKARIEEPSSSSSSSTSSSSSSSSGLPQSSSNQPLFRSPRQDTNSFPQRTEGRIESIPLKAKFLRYIQQGSKTIEGRINTGAFRYLKAGQTVRFFFGNNDGSQTEVLCKIIKINHYSSFREMLTRENYRLCIPDVYSVDEAAAIYASIPTYPQKERQFGVLAIHISKVS